MKQSLHVHAQPVVAPITAEVVVAPVQHLVVQTIVVNYIKNGKFLSGH